MPNYVPISEATLQLRKASRVLVIGCSGGGKTTLSTRIAKAYNLEYVSIDRDIRWLPGWQERNRQVQRTKLAAVVSKERWIIDGSGTSTFDIRLPRTDLVLWVRVPRRTALKGVAGRVWRNYGKVRASMAEGCPEKLPDREFLSYIWHFEKKQVPKFIQQIDLHGPRVPVCLLSSHTSMNEFFDTECPQGNHRV